MRNYLKHSNTGNQSKPLSPPPWQRRVQWSCFQARGDEPAMRGEPHEPIRRTMHRGSANQQSRRLLAMDVTVYTDGIIQALARGTYGLRREAAPASVDSRPKRLGRRTEVIDQPSAELPVF